MFKNPIRIVTTVISLILLSGLNSIHAQQTDTDASDSANQTTQTVEQNSANTADREKSTLIQATDKVAETVSTAKQQIENEVSDLLQAPPQAIIDASATPLTTTHFYSIGGGVITGAIIADLLGGGGLVTLAVTSGGALFGKYLGDVVVENSR